MFKPISISFSPNYERDDVVLALKLIFGSYDKNLSPAKMFRNKFSKYINCKNISLFSSGRAGMYYGLKALGIKEGDEVLLQAFTCVSVPNSIRWTGAAPVFVDVDVKTYNMDSEDLERKITSKSKAIIIQHTFGIPADINTIKKIAHKHRLFLIEDCAHALGGSYNNKPLGSFGDISIFSFGRDKMLSSVFGGAIVSKNQKTAKKIEIFENKLSSPPAIFELKQLLYLIIYAISLPFYNVLAGRFFLKLARCFGLLSQAVYSEERRGEIPDFISFSFSDKLIFLLLNQWDKFEELTKKRFKISDFYIKTLRLPLKVYPYIRVPVLVEDKKSVLKKAKEQGLHLGNWYRGPVDPPNSDLTNINYKRCKNAEYLAEHTINLPTHINISLKDAKRVANLINRYVKRGV